MTITEPERHELYQAVEEKMGRGPADTLLAMLPPVGWADVATKHDLEHLADMNRLEHEQLATQADLERTVREQTRTLFFGLAGMNASIAALVLAAAQLFGG